MVLQTMPVNDVYSVSVGFEDGSFGIETLYMGRVLDQSRTRCEDIVQAGRCVAARLERLGRGIPNRSERDQIVSILVNEKQEIESRISHFVNLRHEDGTLLDDSY